MAESTPYILLECRGTPHGRHYDGYCPCSPYHPAIYRGTEERRAQGQQRSSVRDVEWNVKHHCTRMTEMKDFLRAVLHCEAEDHGQPFMLTRLKERWVLSIGSRHRPGEGPAQNLGQELGRRR
jgi:hypothetical protein